MSTVLLIHLTMIKQVTLFISCLLLLQVSAEDQPRDLLCDVCMDIVTDIDEWITSDATVDEILHFVEGVR